MNEAVKNRELKETISKDYEWGFVSDVEQEFAPKGLNEDTVRFISAKDGTGIDDLLAEAVTIGEERKRRVDTGAIFARLERVERDAPRVRHSGPSAAGNTRSSGASHPPASLAASNQSES